MSDHPLFVEHVDHQWVGSLANLLPEIRRRAYKLGPEKTPDDRENDRDWAWVVLRGGVVVGYRIRSDLYMRGELRIARSEPLTNPKKWEAELRTFFHQFGLTLTNGEPAAEGGTSFMLQPPHEHDREKTAARFMQLRFGETAPGRALCWTCLQAERRVDVEWFPAGGVKGQRCNTCARKPEATQLSAIP